MSAGRDGQPSLRVHLLGRFRLVVDGEERRLLAPRLRRRRKREGAAIDEQSDYHVPRVHLLIQRLSLAADQRLDFWTLAEWLWPTADQTARRYNLTTTLAEARRLLWPAGGARAGGWPFLVRQGNAISLCRAGRAWVDLDALRTLVETARRAADPIPPLEEALALWGGAVLADQPDTEDGAEEEETWLATARGAAHALIEEAVLVFATHRERQHPLPPVEVWRRLLAVDPASEPAHRGLMRLHLAAGRPQEALRQYQRLTRVLDRDLGILPDGETAALVAAILHAAAGRASDARAAAARPAPATPLLGRAHELAALADWLRDPAVRLVTLTGPGGIGKSLLARHAADAVRAAFPEGVALAPLAPLVDPAQVSPAIAEALDLPDDGAGSLAGRLADHLRPRRLLLLLDNMEHLLPAAPLIADLLTAAPGLTVLATSQAPLGLAAERLLPVPPLATPDPSRPLPPPTDLARVPTVALFLQRAEAIGRPVTLDERTAPAVAALCAELGGWPLAIELAAARLALLVTPAALLARLRRDPLAELVNGRPDQPARHRTLHATIAWTYRLLPVSSQRLLERLALFAGGADLAAVGAVWPDPAPGDGDALASLHDLVGLSLVQVSAADGEPRVDLLAPIRAFAAAHLAERVDEADARARHAIHYLTFAETANRGLAGADGMVWAARLARERGNLEAALDWLADAPDRAGAGLRLAAALWRFWQLRGYLRPGRAWLERLLALAPGAAAETRAAAAVGAGALAWKQGDHAGAATHLETALATWGERDDRDALAGRATALKLLGAVETDRPAPRREQALVWLEESLALRRALGDDDGVAAVLNDLATAALDRGDLAAAHDHLVECLAICQRRRLAHGVAMALINLAQVALLQGNGAGARAALADGLPRNQALGIEEGIVYGLLVAAGLAAQSGPDQARPAIEVHAAAEALADRLGFTLPAVDRRRYDELTAAARHHLGTVGWSAALAAGRALSTETAVAAALGFVTALPPDSRAPAHFC
ncbi:MAG: tetratricopeptide repeat protein [Chloroflexi bacterium]|nr:tetratricopeptide repeat protein [Chloroflexota bacterium]